MTTTAETNQNSNQTKMFYTKKDRHQIAKLEDLAIEATTEEKIAELAALIVCRTQLKRSGIQAALNVLTSFCKNKKPSIHIKKEIKKINSYLENH